MIVSGIIRSRPFAPRGSLQALGSVHNLVFLIVWPAASAAFLFFIAAYSIPTFDLTTNIVGLGGIAIGVVPLLLNRKRRRRVGNSMKG